MAIRSYRDRGSRDIAAGANSKAARKVLPASLHDLARRRLAFLNAARSLDDLRARSGLNLHELKRDRAGEYAIRINAQYRICFFWKQLNSEDVEITDYH